MTVEASGGYRVRPTLALALAIYAGYLAIFYTTWAINDVDYENIGDSLESTKLHYAYPTLFGCAFVVVALTSLGWWRIVLFDKSRVGPRWAWIGPAAMLVIAVVGFTLVDPDHPEFSGSLVLWGLLGGLGVGLGEEMITRGSLVVGLRSDSTEGHVWLISSLMFSALHIPNVFFGISIGGMVFQVVNTFIFGSFLYAVRRFSGTLLVPIVLHGLWDSSLFMPRATESDGNLLSVAFIPVMAVVAFVVIRQNKDLRLGFDGAERIA